MEPWALCVCAFECVCVCMSMCVSSCVRLTCGSRESLSVRGRGHVRADPRFRVRTCGWSFLSRPLVGIFYFAPPFSTLHSDDNSTLSSSAPIWWSIFRFEAWEELDRSQFRNSSQRSKFRCNLSSNSAVHFVPCIISIAMIWFFGLTSIIAQLNTQGCMNRNSRVGIMDCLILSHIRTSCSFEFKILTKRTSAVILPFNWRTRAFSAKLSGCYDFV